jgi:transposase
VALTVVKLEVGIDRDCRVLKAMAKHRSHSIQFKRQVAQEFIAGETLHALVSRHGVSRNLIRFWVRKFEAGAFDDDARAVDLLEDYKNALQDAMRLLESRYWRRDS